MDKQRDQGGASGASSFCRAGFAGSMSGFSGCWPIAMQAIDTGIYYPRAGRTKGLHVLWWAVWAAAATNVAPKEQQANQFVKVEPVETFVPGKGVISNRGLIRSSISRLKLRRL